ncbi:MAG: FUSC family protein, partial [Allobranchiibius sp.]
IVIVVMGGAMLISAQVGAGPAIIIAGFTAIFFTLGIGGGSLRADLRKAAWYGPLTALSASVPRIVAEFELGVALAVVAVIVFVAGLLPALGRNYQQAGLGLGLITVLGFALQTDTGSAAQTVLGAFVGVVFVVLLRILLKFRDPSDVTRELAAATLTQPDPAFGQAYTMWLRDKPVRWIDDVLQVAVGYRTLRGVLEGQDAARADARAEEVAAVVAAQKPSSPATDSPADAQLPDPSSSASDTAAVRHALRALDRIEQLARSRDEDVVPDATATRRVFARASIRSVLVWRSQILRHALRTAIGVVLTFLLAWATVGPKDPLVTSMATAAFAILQISWSQTLVKAKQRLLGVGGGAAVMAIALWLLPQGWLLPFALLGALAGLWLIASNQVLSIGAFVLVSVGMNVVTRELDPSRTLLEYVLLLLAGVMIGLLCGFVVVPHLEPDRVDTRVAAAREAVVQLLQGTARLAPTETGQGGGSVHPAVLVKPLHEVRTRAQNLASPLHRADEQAGVSATECRSLATRFETLATVGLVEAAEGRLSAETLDAAAAVLAQPLGEEDALGAPDFVRLAQWVGIGSRQLGSDGSAVHPAESENTPD